MTNEYKLEEFKAWLEEKPERKADLPRWPSAFSQWRNLAKSKEWNEYAAIVNKWKREVDRAESARKKEEREQEESPNMVNAQEWLNQKFPTQESKEPIKSLSLYGSCISRTSNTSSAADKCFYDIGLQGALDLNGFINLERLTVSEQEDLTEIKGLENLPKLVFLSLDANEHFKCSTFLAAWKQEIQFLKAQLAEHENQETSSQTSTEISYSDLTTKIAQKKQELTQLRDNTRQPTKHLRKEIELLEKIQTLETQITAHQQKEANYQAQIRQKDQQINAKQSQITTLQSQLTAKTTAEKQAQTKIKQLEKQIKDLTAEKAALQEKMLKERQEALAEWNKEKQTLQTQITQLNEQKDTFQKSADYLRSTLKDTEQTLTNTQSTLARTQENAQQSATNHQATLNQKDEELAKKQETYSLIQERNSDLQNKLASSQEEVNKLTQWISKLEAASAEGDALQTLQKELNQARQENQTLQEQLDAKNPQRNYLWLYVIIALIALYFLMS